MAKKKEVYSSWFRDKLEQDKLSQVERERALEQMSDEERAQYDAEQRQIALERQRKEQERLEARRVRSESIMKRDLEDDLDNLYVYERDEAKEYIDEAETPQERKKRIKEEEKIKKARERQLAKEEKERQKALKKRTAEEGKSKKSEEDIIDADTNVRIQMEREMIRRQRARESEDRKAYSARERNKATETAELLKIQKEKERLQSAAMEEEYKRQERLRREKEENDRRIQKKRQKAAGSTPWRRLSEKIRIFLRIYSFQNLKDTINTYGYSYSFSEFIKQTLAIVGGVTFIAWYSKVRGGYLFAIVALTTLSIPFLLYSWFNQQFNSKRFEMVQSYLSNIIPVFMQKPKIRYALGEVKDMSQGQMETAIQHALDYIDTTTDDENIMTTALTFIENEFPNSRIKAVHKLLLDIESGNSKDYNAICENMYTDVEAWIRRVYGFQKDLKQRRTSLIVLCAFSLILNSVFTVMYSSNEIFNGFTDRPLYQISTSIFIMLIMLTIALIVTRLHGSWLIYDAENKEEEENARAYTYIHMNTPTIKKKDLITAGIFAVAGLFVVFGLGNTTGVVIFLFVIIFATKSKTTWNAKKRRVSKALMLEFPVWLRGVALNLHEMTVINSIKESQKTCSFAMSKEIDKFFEIYNENPTSIRAFNEFLADYKIEDVQATMKVLFTVQSMSAGEIQNQVAMLINRNQELLTKTETIQNQDSLGYAEMLGYAPMVLLTGQLLMSMVLMFLHIMDYMDMIMAEGMQN